MMLVRRYAVVLYAFITTSVACSSSDGGGGTSPSGGSDSGTQGKGNACQLSDCPKEPPFLSDDDCAQVLAGGCSAEVKAYVACSRANDKCTADGEQDLSAFTMCLDAANAATRCLSGDAGAR